MSRFSKSNIKMKAEKIKVSSQNRMLAESLFKVFDDDNSGTFSFEEYYQVFACGLPVRDTTISK